MLINKQLWFANPNTFNDPFDCRLDYKTALQKSFEALNVPQAVDESLLYQTLDEKIMKARVCCFSKIKKNQLMWAHYADEHKGFCIGFNVSQLLRNGNNLKVGFLTVDYKAHNPYQDITKNFRLLHDIGGQVYNSNLADEFLKSALATKYTGWKYEKEVRLISTKIETLDFHPESINSITFGLRMKENDRNSLRNLLSGCEWEHLKWFDTNIAEDRYALNFNPL
jgi:hypothetical protein